MQNFIFPVAYNWFLALRLAAGTQQASNEYVFDEWHALLGIKCFISKMPVKDWEELISDCKVPQSVCFMINGLLGQSTFYVLQSCNF